jgi:predicted GNAT family acetyltransferase
MPDVTDNTDLRRFEMAVDGLIAYVTYALCGDRITLIHTQVPSELGGRGIGSALARSVLDNIRLRGLRVVAECEFIGGFIQKHQVYADLLVA